MRARFDTRPGATFEVWKVEGHNHKVGVLGACAAWTDVDRSNMERFAVPDHVQFGMRGQIGRTSFPLRLLKPEAVEIRSIPRAVWYGNHGQFGIRKGLNHVQFG